MTANHDAFVDYVDKLLQARPDHAIARLFVPAAQRDGMSAFECLVFELEQTLWHAREAAVAAVKLNWWAEELQRTLEGNARHPITQQLPLVAQPDAARAAIASLSRAAVALLETPAAADFATQRTQAARFYLPLGEIEAALFDRGAVGHEPRALSLLLRELGRLALGQKCSEIAIPLHLLARHQLAREALIDDSPAREALLRDQLAHLDAAFIGLSSLPGARFPVRVRAHADASLTRRALRASQPSRVLRERAGVGWSTPWQAWREARRGG